MTIPDFSGICPFIFYETSCFLCDFMLWIHQGTPYIFLWCNIIAVTAIAIANLEVEVELVCLIRTAVETRWLWHNVTVQCADVTWLFAQRQLYPYTCSCTHLVRRVLFLTTILYRPLVLCSFITSWGMDEVFWKYQDKLKIISFPKLWSEFSLASLT